MDALSTVRSRGPRGERLRGRVRSAGLRGAGRIAVPLPSDALSTKGAARGWCGRRVPRRTFEFALVSLDRLQRSEQARRPVVGPVRVGGEPQSVGALWNGWWAHGSHSDAVIRKVLFGARRGSFGEAHW